MKFNPEGLATSIGSLPHLDEKSAAVSILAKFSRIPAWPQLPKKNFYEDMRVQFSEGLPGAVCQFEKQRFYLAADRGLEKKLEKFYQQYISGNLDYFAISRQYAAGFYSFLSHLSERLPEKLVYLKGQLTGPISAGLSITDENKRAVIYRDELRDVLTKQVRMKAKWQIRELKRKFPRVIIFLDEPYLASFGSAYINLDKETVRESLQEVVTAIQESGALAGIHCCGNTDWSLPLETTLDILSFDAFGFSENLSLYADNLKPFLNKGGILSWGIVPSRQTDDKNLKVEILLEKLESGFQMLAKKGIEPEVLKKSCLLTPSCGTGSLSVDLSERILETTRLLSEKFREKHLYV